MTIMPTSDSRMKPVIFADVESLRFQVCEGQEDREPCHDIQQEFPEGRIRIDDDQIAEGILATSY